MNTTKFNTVASALILAAFYSVPHQAHAFEWQNLWSTPEQRASKQLDSQKYDELIEQAPDTSWQGVGEYRKGDYKAAIESFSQQRELAALAGSQKEIEQAMYNQANALTKSESYSEAISLFDELLELNPDHSDATHNRAIAEQLLEQQEQEQEQNQQGSDDEQQDSEKSEGEEGDQSEQEQGDQQENDESEQQDQAEQDAQSEQAEQAMQAEQAEDAENEATEQEAQAEATPAGDQAEPDPLTEKEQANEQWLRQIPDDPAGLLQRKLQNRHLTDFPKVKDSVNPW